MSNGNSLALASTSSLTPLRTSLSADQNSPSSLRRSVNQQGSNSEASSSTASKTYDTDFYFTFVVFEVENCLFRVPTRILVEESEYFSTLMKLKPGAEASQEDLSGAIALSGVHLRDFRNFLKVLYPISVNLKVTLCMSEWISVLKLATKWKFHNLREMAISELDALTMSGPLKITTGRLCLISYWLRSGLTEVVKREKTIESWEASCIGYQDTFELFRLRERRLNDPYHTSVEKDIVSKFRIELLCLNSRAEEQGFKLNAKAQNVLSNASTHSESEMISSVRKRRRVV